MAIHKKSKKTTIYVDKKCRVTAGKIVQIAGRVNIEATKWDLTLISNVKVLMRGNKK